MHLKKWTQPNILQKNMNNRAYFQSLSKIYIVHNQNQQALKYIEWEED